MHGMTSLGTREMTECWLTPGDWVHFYGITLVHTTPGPDKMF